MIAHAGNSTGLSEGVCSTGMRFQLYTRDWLLACVAEVLLYLAPPKFHARQRLTYPSDAAGHE